MAGRPLLNLKLAELTEWLVTHPEDQALVIVELGHRKSPGAKKLLAQLDGSGSAKARDLAKNPDHKRHHQEKLGAQARVGQRGRAHSDKQMLDTHGEIKAVRESRPVGVDPDLVCRYEILRNTFTVEGEILARWGMTDEVPREIEEAVFKMWRAGLSNIPDHRGRSLMCLEIDICRLADERSRPISNVRGYGHGS